MRRQKLLYSARGIPRLVSKDLGRVLAVLLTASLWGSALAESLTPALFVALELRVRELTVNDMETRLGLIQAHAHDEAWQQSTATAAQISQIYANHGTTPYDHAGYGATQAEAIAAWLDVHPHEQQRLRDLDNRFETLSAQFNTQMTGRQ